MDTARFKYPSFWVDLDRLYDSVKSLDKDSNEMRGFMVLSKNQNVKDMQQLISKEENKTKTVGISFSDILPEDMPRVRLMSDLSNDQLQKIIQLLNDDSIKIHLFKFLHDLHMVFGNQTN